MPWFKVDDNYWSHPKVMFQSLEASGMWVRAASWTANHLTDGRIPIKVLHMIMPKRAVILDGYAGELEESGMWLRDGDTWVFHDWTEYQPTRQDVETERARQRERQARWRERRVSNAVTNGGSNGAPTRPDPTRPDPSLLSTSAAPQGPSASTTEERAPAPPCEHGAESRLCALCRMNRKRTR